MHWGEVYVVQMSNKRHICLFPNKLRYKHSVTYEVGGSYQAGNITLKLTLPKYDNNI